MLTQPHCWQHQVLQLQRCTSEWRDGRRWENEEKGGKEWRYIKTQSSQIFRSSSSALPSALPDLDSASASAAHVGNTDVTGPRDLYILRERGSVFIVYGFGTSLQRTRRILQKLVYSVVQTASDCAEQRFTKMSSTEAGKSPPAKRRRTVADVKVQTIMTQEEIDHLDSPVWTVSFLFYKLL